MTRPEIFDFTIERLAEARKDVRILSFKVTLSVESVPRHSGKSFIFGNLYF